MPSPAKHRLVAETKRLAHLVALLDADDLDDAEVEVITKAVGVAADAVADLPALAGLAGEGPDGALEERSPFSGRSNPLAPPMTIVPGEITTATATWTAEYEGPKDTLHGGFVAAAFDDLLGVAQMASGTAGFTGTLTVKMRRPTPLDTLIEYEAGVIEQRGRKIVCWGTARANGELVAEAECLFVTPKDRAVW
jgi:acyl-coenzyme A thioesterase PaaI-like protein